MSIDVGSDRRDLAPANTHHVSSGYALMNTLEQLPRWRGKDPATHALQLRRKYRRGSVVWGNH